MACFACALNLRGVVYVYSCLYLPPCASLSLSLNLTINSIEIHILHHNNYTCNQEYSTCMDEMALEMGLGKLNCFVFIAHQLASWFTAAVAAVTANSLNGKAFYTDDE